MAEQQPTAQKPLTAMTPEELKEHGMPTPALRWNGDVLEQMWTGRNDNPNYVWVPVPQKTAS